LGEDAGITKVIFVCVIKYGQIRIVSIDAQSAFLIGRREIMLLVSTEFNMYAEIFLEDGACGLGSVAR
jgi:hypothetical protein